MSISSSRWDENIDFQQFIAELDQNPAFVKYPAYIIFKQENKLLLGRQWTDSATLIEETWEKFRDLDIKLDYIDSDSDSVSEETKMNLAQRCILAKFLLQASLDWAYMPDTTWISGIIHTVIISLIPPSASH